jgi:hypothetical protein
MVAKATEPQGTMPTDLLTYHQAAELIGISYSAIAQAVGNKRLHPIRVPGRGKYKYLSRAEVLAYRDRVPVMSASTPAAPSMDALSSLMEALGANAGTQIQNIVKDGVSGVITTHVAMFQVAMGGPVTADPKLLATFMKR